MFAATQTTDILLPFKKLLQHGHILVELLKGQAGTVAQAGQRGGAIPLSLIFFATFLHQGKKVEYNLVKDAC